MEKTTHSYGSQFQIPFQPLANPEAVIVGPQVRFTVLTSRLIRLEYSAQNQFEDRASQTFWFRQQPVPDFEVHRSDTHIEIQTQHLHLNYMINSDGFTPQHLKIRILTSGIIWQFGDHDSQNLQGTARTLDEVNGYTQLEPGLISRSGWAVVDDSSGLVFKDPLSLEPRCDDLRSPDLDLYFFGYEKAYHDCLRDFYKVTGLPPLLPRMALGNWWSRYWAYHEEELKQLIEDFQSHRIPLSVCIIDMDWHLVETGNTSPGWTGYTWNRELFPDPRRFLEWLHKQGLATSLNLHPADGVHPHEKQYPAMAQFLGVDPQTQEPVRFDMTNPKFIQAYFEMLHHPEEAIGIDFWWIDWQQGTQSKTAGLDPLWSLNHLHFYDLGRDGKKRSFIFSRWGGLSNHRYPIGFSGDTLETWESLAYQPYFTATAANVGYGWWSHDIGGHHRGTHNSELYTRWVQYGVFSPIMRLHSGNSSFLERRPWGFDIQTLEITRSAMRLRHAMIPYLYTMSWKNREEALPLCRPMYYHHAHCEEAYHCPNQYYFGTELIAAPYVEPLKPDLGMSRQTLWLPDGDWFHFFDGSYYKGNRWYALYGTLEEIPIFAKSGAIVPFGPMTDWGGIENPEYLEITIFPGANNRFDLFEDDGVSQQSESALTTFKLNWQTSTLKFTVSPAEGNLNILPKHRQYTLRFRGICNPSVVDVEYNETPLECAIHYDAQTNTLEISDILLVPEDHLQVRLSITQGSLISKRDRREETLRAWLHRFQLDIVAKGSMDQRLEAIMDDVTAIAPFLVDLSESQIRALVEWLVGVGITEISHISDDTKFILWNNEEQSEVRYRHSHITQWENYRHDGGPIPKFRIIPTATEGRWKLWVNYLDLITLFFQRTPHTNPHRYQRHPHSWEANEE